MALAENLILLGATAGLTGILVPLIKGRTDQRKLLEQKRFEADLARQTKVIESQGALLERLSELLWAQALRTVEVSYRAFRGEQDLFQAAWDRYDTAVWSFFIQARAEISKARQLTSAHVHDTLLALYQQFMTLDLELGKLAGVPSLQQDKWAEFHSQVLGPVGDQVDDALRNLADEFRLSVPLTN